MGAAMRGSDAVTGALFSYVDLEDRVPADHPLRVIRAVVNEVLRALDADFGAMYSDFGRQSIPPERLLRGSLIQAFYTVRSERQLMEQLDYNLLFRWFVGLGIDDPVWDHSTYSKNRDRLLEADIAKKFLAAILAHSQVAPLLSDDHFRLLDELSGWVRCFWVVGLLLNPVGRAFPVDVTGGGQGRAL